MKKKKIIVPIYGTIVKFYRTDGDFEELKKKLSKKYYLSISSTAGGFCASKIIKGFHVLIIVVDVNFYKKKSYGKADFLGVIVHEVVHAVNYMFAQKGILLDRYNDESQAYITEWIFRKAYKFFK